MGGEFIHNPRRAPRIPVQCKARIALRTGSFFASTTLDIGRGGCRVEAPARVTPGEQVFVELQDARVSGSHLLSGKVAWCSKAPPWRCGIAFDRGSARAAAALFDESCVAHPDAAGASGRIEKIPADALLTPTPLPGGLTVVPAEAEILREVGDGIRARALRDRMGERWAAYVNALFALLERRAIEVGDCAPEGALSKDA